MGQAPSVPIPEGPTRTLYLTVSKQHKNQGAIFDQDEETILYTTESHSWHKPHFILKTADGQPIGSFTTHFFRMHTDISIHGKNLILKGVKVKGSGWIPRMPSDTPGTGGYLQWQQNSCVCVNADGQQLVATGVQQPQGRHSHSNGKAFMMLSGDAIHLGPLMDEVVLGTVARAAAAAQQASRMAMASAGAAGGGGGGGC